MPQTDLETFNYIYIDNQASHTLFLLHGTGGTERDLLSLVEPLSSKYNFVGLRGNISEQGMARFFARTAHGTFDQQSIQAEVTKLAAFLQAWFVEHGLSVIQTAYLGYSNGANMLLALSFLKSEVTSRAVLLHPMLPFEPPDKTEFLKGKSYLVSYGEQDPLVSVTDSQKVITTLEKAGARVKSVHHQGGHEIRESEIQEIVRFLE